MTQEVFVVYGKPYVGKRRQAPDEKRLATIDFSQWLNAGETISSVTSTTSPVDGSSAQVTGLANTSTQVSFFFGGGAPGVDYIVYVSIVTSAGQDKDVFVKFPVRSLSPSPEGVPGGMPVISRFYGTTDANGALSIAHGLAANTPSQVLGFGGVVLTNGAGSAVVSLFPGYVDSTYVVFEPNPNYPNSKAIVWMMIDSQHTGF